ncbi:unnamed protein product, partial [Gongylonema pulchrum]|uniref:PUM-HD domain-containing protein n=1 Tax=Gongylonema pulchrum TaxID=637853 RepID=A0A183CY77_9BILA
AATVSFRYKNDSATSGAEVEEGSLQLGSISAQQIPNEQQQSQIQQQQIGFQTPAYAFSYNPDPYLQAQQLHQQYSSIAGATSQSFREHATEITRIACYQQQTNVPGSREYLMVTGRPQQVFVQQLAQQHFSSTASVQQQEQQQQDLQHHAIVTDSRGNTVGHFSVFHALYRFHPRVCLQQLREFAGHGYTIIGAVQWERAVRGDTQRLASSLCAVACMQQLWFCQDLLKFRFFLVPPTI